MAKKDQTIYSLISAEGTKRVYHMEDGSIQTREGGTVSWRNNNPGNLKLEYANSADHSVRTRRTKDEALNTAQSKYQGVVALDQWGNAVFATEEAGRAAQSTLLTRGHGEHTVEQMLPSYAVNDYSGKANLKAYAQGIYAAGDAQGVDLRDKKIGEMSAAEMSALQDGMKKVEGYKAGDVKVSPPSFRQLEEKSLQKMNEEGLAPHAARASIADSAHPGQPMFSQAQSLLQKIDAQYGRKPDQLTDNAAAAITVAAHKAGLTRIDQLELGAPDNSRIFAIQGTPGMPFSKMVVVPTVEAMHTPIAQSAKAFAEVQQAQPHAAAQEAQQVPHPARQQAAPAPSL